MNLILARLLQPSTIRGIIMLVSGIVAIMNKQDPSIALAALSSGVIGSGAVGVATNDNKPVAGPTQPATLLETKVP